MRLGSPVHLVSGGLRSMEVRWTPTLVSVRVAVPFLDLFLGRLGFVSWLGRHGGGGSLKMNKVLPA